MSNHQAKEQLKSRIEKQTSEDIGKGMTVQEAGRRGGQTTFRNKGNGFFRKIGRKGGNRTAELYHDLLSEFGKKGGRPRRPALTEYMEGEDQ